MRKIKKDFICLRYIIIDVIGTYNIKENKR